MEATGHVTALSVDVGALNAELLRYARRLVGPSDAEDLVQSTWLAAERSITHWSPEKGTLAAWMTTILRRQAVDAYRRSARVLPFGHPHEAPDPADEVVAWDRWRECLGYLSSGERAAVELVYGDGLPLADAALKLGLCPHAVASRLSRARQRLRACLAA